MSKNTLKNRNPDKLRTYGILDKWHSMTVDDFTNSPKALKVVKKYLSNADEAMDDGVGLFLWGANGTGKSMLMNTAFMELQEQGYKVRIITLSTLITKFTAGWYDAGEKYELNKILQTTDFLGIEEIGKEFKSSTDLGSVVLDSIIRFRVQMKKPIWATTNKEPQALTSYYTEDIASMLRECCVPVQVVGKDFRIDISDTLIEKYK